MEPNACGLDRHARLVFGPALLLAAIALGRRSAPGRPGRLVRLGLGLWGVEVLLTGLVGWCPLNYALGINTCERGWTERFRDRFGPAREDGAATASADVRRR